MSSGTSSTGKKGPNTRGNSQVEDQVTRDQEPRRSEQRTSQVEDPASSFRGGGDPQRDRAIREQAMALRRSLQTHGDLIPGSSGGGPATWVPGHVRSAEQKEPPRRRPADPGTKLAQQVMQAAIYMDRQSSEWCARSRHKT